MSSRRARLVQERRWFLEMLALTSFVIAQPILDVFGKSPETFVFNRSGVAEIVFFAVSVAALPAVAIWLVAATAGALWPRVRPVVQILVVWLLLTLLSIQVFKKVTALREMLLLFVGALVGATLAWVFSRFTVARRGLYFAWPAPVAFVLIFLLVSPVSKLVLPASEGATAAQRAVPVTLVMLVFDQLPLLSLVSPDGTIDADRFPNFARLAEDATWYRNYTVTESYTRYSIPTMLTGQLVTDRSTYPLASDYPDNLFSLLRDSHRLDVVESVSELCSPQGCSQAPPDGEPATRTRSLLSEAISVWSELSLPGEERRDVGAQFQETLAEEAGEPANGDLTDAPTKEERLAHFARHRQPLQFTRFLQNIDSDAPPTLRYLHLIVPHYPWRFFPSGLRYSPLPRAEDMYDVPESRPRRWVTESYPMELMRQRHLLQVQYADTLLGALLDRLVEANTYEESIVVVTSDHGHSLFPGRARSAMTGDNLHEIISVPLLVKAPYQEEGVIDDRNLSAPDLLPTLAALLDVKIPWPVDGGSALDPTHDRGPTKSVIRYRDNPAVPMETRALSIGVSELQRRLRHEAVRPQRVPVSSDPSHFMVGAGAELVGRATGDFVVGDAVTETAALDRLGALDDVDPASGTVPALVTGHLQGSGVERREIVVAVNGRMAGAAPTFSYLGVSDRFAVLVPPRLLHEGHNQLELFVKEGAILRPVRIA